MSTVRLRLPLPRQTGPEQLATIVAPLMGLDPDRLAQTWACDGVAYSGPLRRDDAEMLKSVLVSFNVRAEFEAARPSSRPSGALDPALVRSGSSTINGMESALLQRALEYLDQREVAEQAAPPPRRPPTRSPRAPRISRRPLALDLPPLATDEPEDLKTLVDPPKGLEAPTWATGPVATGLPAPRRPRRRPTAPRAPLEHPSRTAVRQQPRPVSAPSGAHRALAVEGSNVVDRRVTLLFWLLFVASAALGALALMR